MKLEQIFRQVPPRDEFDEFEQEDEELSFEEQTSRELHRVIDESYQALENLGLRKRAYFCVYDIQDECHWTKVQTPASNYVHAANEFEALEKFVGQLKIEKGVVVSRISIRNPHTKWSEDVYGASVKTIDAETKSKDFSDYHNGKGTDLINYDGERFFVDGQEVERENPIYQVLNGIDYLEEGHNSRMLKAAIERTDQQLRELGEE